MSQPELIRGLGLRDATALVIGTIIGTGVFLETTPMAQAVGAPQWVLWGTFTPPVPAVGNGSRAGKSVSKMQFACKSASAR